MHLTRKVQKIYLIIKDLKIYRKKKKITNITTLYQKRLFKKVSLQIMFKNLKIGGASKI